MLFLIRPRIGAVWLFLLAIFCVSWVISYYYGVYDRVLVNAVVMSLAIVKVYLVGMYFMDLRTAPAMLRCAFVAWCGLCCLAVVVLPILKV